MLKDVTLGRYYSADSIVHRLDPRLKINFTLVYIILSLLDRNLPLFAMLTVIFVMTLIGARVPLGYIVRGCRSIFIVILVCSAINIFTTPGETVLSVGAIVITHEGIIKFLFVLWRMVLIIFMTSMLMYTTTPTNLADGLEKCFHLSGNVAMGITIALRFVSVLFEELDRIMKSQEARGVDFKSGGPISKIRKYKTLLVPLFQNSINRAANLGEALDARCYTGGKGRTKIKPLKYGFVDLLLYLVLIGVLAVGVWMVFKF